MVAFYQHGVVALGDHGAIPSSFHSGFQWVELRDFHCTTSAPTCPGAILGVMGFAYPVVSTIKGATDAPHPTSFFASHPVGGGYRLTDQLGAAHAQNAVRVGSKIDTEGKLLGNMVVLALEANGIKTENKVSLGNTKVVRTALMAGEIDLYPEYTGNGAFMLGDERQQGMEETCAQATSWPRKWILRKTKSSGWNPPMPITPGPLQYAKTLPPPTS